MMSVACKAVAVGMGAAVIAFGGLHIASAEVCVFLLGVGLFALAIMPLTIE